MVSSIVMFYLLRSIWVVLKFSSPRELHVPNVIESMGHGAFLGWLWSLFVTAGFIMFGWGTAPYFQWFSLYFDDHSVLLWLMTTVPITGALVVWHFVAVRMFINMPQTIMTHAQTVANGPVQRQLTGQAERTAIRYTPNLPWLLVPTAALWGWLLLTPTLPIHDCFIRIALLGEPASRVLSYF